jgi:hypothetical protein
MSGGRMAILADAAAGIGLIALLGSPLLRTPLEASLVGHVLVQMPLLALSGWLLAGTLAPRFDAVMARWNRGGVAGLMAVIFTALFWMLPLSVDRAVQDGGYEGLKFMSLPCAGAALALSVRRMQPLLIGALKANLISMLGVLTWLYAAAPVRLCNSYLRSDQETLGAAMAFLALTLAVTWGSSVLFGARPSGARSLCPGENGACTPVPGSSQTALYRR